MRRRLGAAGLLLALAGGAAGEELDCVAGLCVGQPFAVDAAEGDWQIADWPDPASCTQVSGGRLPAGVGMMLLDGRIARFEIGLSGDGAAAPAGPFGLRRGMSLADAGARLPDDGLALDVHKYAWPPGLYLTWHDATRDRGVRVELPDGAVEVILWGRADAVRLTEGCV
ncbi:hypothetical protein [Luteimonas sp. SDU101]|uniref:hypothetical protein n=1 Tax=Luteimonas sp. SDU101 TaxID=3422593 RepID=UPI003EBF6EA6